MFANLVCDTAMASESSIRAAFDHFDADGSGEISGRELAELVRYMYRNEDKSDEEIAEIAQVKLESRDLFYCLNISKRCQLWQRESIGIQVNVFNYSQISEMSSSLR